MRKLMFMILIGGCGAWYFKNNVNLTGDDHTHTVGFALPTLGVGSASGIMGTLSSYLPGQTQTQAAQGLPRVNTASAAGAAAVPAPAPAPAPAGGLNTSGLSPDILKLLNLSNSASGTQSLSPAALQTLQKLIAQARANPAAFQEQYGAIGKATQGVK